MRRESVVEHIPGLRRYARALTADPWAADDLVQDTLERACSRWRLWLAGSDLRAWLFTLMHNLFISQLRQVQSRRAHGREVDLEDVAHTLQAPDAAQASMLDLQRCLLCLPLNQREVLLLVALEELSYAEVAKITATPIGTVMSRLSRAREHMRELMDQASHAPQASTPPVLRRLK
jgi:RNA polymerase sigma-70 factor (ECF subfamily)